jgi:type VI secretion system protein ImpE
VRYPGSEADQDGAIRLSRKTEWHEVAPQTFHGRGQRMFATDADEYPLLNVRTIELVGA